MKISKLFRIGLIASACFAAVGVSNAASTGTIEFKGSITASTCSVAIDGKGADGNGIVNMPESSVSDFTTATTSGRTEFNLVLTGCTITAPDTQVGAFFESGANVDTTTGRLINTGTATGVSLQLLDSSANVINVGDAGQKNDGQFIIPDAGGGTLPYSVEYYKDADGTLAGGTVEGTVVYSLMYK
ncbi:type 1 fimbrial protein [Citrobacter amalonaticus]|uniref:fimbrial protein n=1 Tax=Citrobacter TaxID=544 RepID=UPI000C8699AA|nr:MULTISPECIES: fimbrial protein [Citrobacter]MBJ9259013.1 type 1 fimbrial protein [Citrobacter amalonaticus]